MARKLNTPDEFYGFVGKPVTEEALLGRGYFHCVSGKIVSTSYSNFPDFDLGEAEEGEDEIMCLDAQNYLASLAAQMTNDCWVTCIPANPRDFEGECYYFLALTLEKKDGMLYTESFFPMIRMVEQMGGGFFYIPGQESVKSRFYEFEWMAGELIDEVHRLVSGRYVPDGFSLVGKPMPENKDAFHPNPPYSIAENSGYRNVYWHLQIDVEEDIIQDVEISTYEAERGMMMRPHPRTDDVIDAHKALIYVSDQYSDAEWTAIMKS